MAENGVDLVVVVVGCAAGFWLLARLRPLPVSAGGRSGSMDGVSVSVIVPARNEATTLPVLLASLCALHPAPDEIIVVDDDSSDETAMVAGASGAKVLGAPALPPGWTGKAWACQVGAQASGGSHLLFLDADTSLAPDALARLLDLHAAKNGGLLSVQPHHRVEQPYEQLSAYFNLVSMMASGAFTPVESARSSMVFGPCLLTTRRDYEVAGGHAAVRGEVLDDVHLAAAYRRSGLPAYCRVGGAAISFRMYPSGFAQLAEGWTKNMAGGATQARLGPAVGAALWVWASMQVSFDLWTGLTAWSGGHAGPPLVWLSAYLVVAAQLYWLLTRIGSFRWWTAAVFPVPLVAFLAVFTSSVLVTYCRHEVRWRGRLISTGRRRAR